MKKIWSIIAVATFLLIAQIPVHAADLTSKVLQNSHLIDAEREYITLDLNVTEYNTYLKDSKVYTGLVLRINEDKFFLDSKQLLTGKKRYYFFDYDGSIMKMPINSLVKLYARDKTGAEHFVDSINIVDSIAPSIEKVKYTTVFARYHTYLSGENAEPNTTATILIGKKTYKSKVKKSGEFKVSFPKQKEGTELLLYFKDESGNISDKITHTVSIKKNAVPIKANNISVNANHVYASFSSYFKGDKAIAKIGKKTYKGKISSKGNISFTIPKQKANTTIVLEYMNSKGQVLANKKIRVYTTKTIKVGMTKSQVIASAFGRADKINKITDAGNTIDEWIYNWSDGSKTYLYFYKNRLVLIGEE